MTSIIVPAKLCELKKVRDFIVNICSGIHSINEERTMQLEIAVNEAVTNVIKHAYKNKENESFTVSATIKEQILEIKITDRGNSFDPSKIDQPSFDGTRESGFGIYIIEKSVDSLVYSFSKGTNVTTLKLFL